MHIFIKLLIIGTAFFIVFKQVDTDMLMTHVMQFPILLLLRATALLILAQYISALRSRFYFKHAGLPLTHHFCVALYFIGSLYNTMLPGGIGGDGYKIYYLGKYSHLTKRTVLRVLLSERANGLLILMLLACFFGYLSDISVLFNHPIWLFAVAALITCLGYCTASRIILAESFKVSMIAALYSLILQLLYVVAAILILHGLHITFDNPTLLFTYVSVFLISNILSVIPISINGVGIRELTFIYAAIIFGLNREIGVAFGVIYFVAYFLMALQGIWFLNQLKKWSPAKPSNT